MQCLDRTIGLGCAVLLLSLWGAAQSPQSSPQSGPQKTPKLTSAAELVLVPTIVTAKDKHVTGLHRDDFEIYEDGVRKNLTVFEEVNASVKPASASPGAAPPVFSNREAEAAPRRLKIIVLDEINTPFLDQWHARQELIKYLSNSATGDDLTELLRFKPGGIEVMHEFTSDPAVLVTALKQARGSIALTENDTGLPVLPQATVPVRAEAGERLARGSSQFEASGVLGRRLAEAGIDSSLSLANKSSKTIRTVAVDSTVAAFETIARACVGLPGRKSLIWISAGFPFLVYDKSVLSPNSLLSRAIHQRLLKLFDSLNAANVAVYPIDPTGLSTFSTRWNPPSGGYEGVYWSIAQRRDLNAAHDAVIESMDEIAHMTGGVAYYNKNDISVGLARASADSATYYMLGYYVSRASTKPGWHKLRVRVAQPHVAVRARSGYFLMPIKDFSPDEARIRDIGNAVGSPLDLSAIAITGRWLQQTALSDGTKRVEYELNLNGVSVDTEDHNHINVQVVGFVTDGKLNEVTRTDQTADAHPFEAEMPQFRQGMRYRNHFDLSPGEYSVKFVVRDNLAGRVGSLSAPLVVQ